MTTATTRIEITAKDSTAAAFASAESNLSNLAGTALKTAAGVAGIGLSIAGAVESIKGVAQATIQLQQFTGTLTVGTGSAEKAGQALSFVRAESKRLGLDLATAADQFGKLAAASKGTSLEGTATRELFSAMAQASTVLGLSADKTTGALNAFQQMISKGKVQAEELRGQLGERLPGAFQMAARAMGVTTQELDKLLSTGKITAEDLLPKLTAELNKTFGDQAEESAKNLSAQINRMNTALFELKIAVGESGLISFLSSGIELATKLTNAMAGVFGGGQKATPIQNQIELIKNLEDELTRMKGLNDVIPFVGNFIFSKKEQDELQYRLESAREDLEKMKAAALIPVPGGKPTLPAKVADDAKGASDALKALNKAQDIALSREHEYIKLLQIERKAHADLVKPYLDSANAADQKLLSMTDEIAAMKLARDREISLEEAIERTTIARLEEKRAIAKDTDVIAQIESEISTRKKMLDLIPEVEKMRSSNKSATDDITQLWIQAGRNIQSALGNFVFDFFNGGLKGMVSNVKNTVLRIVSEFTGLKIAQSIGLAGMFGAAGNAAASGGSGGGFSLMNGASMASNALSFFRSGFGATELIGSGLSGLGSLTGSSSLAAFGGGFAGDAIGGLAAGGFSAGAASAASLGASMAAVAGPLAAVFALTQGFRVLAGDKRMGGGFGKVMNTIGDIPILGDFIPVIPLMNSLFGRGPLKQKETQLTGDIGAEGLLSGYLTANFKAKGGLLVGDKHDFAGVNLLTGAAETDNKKLQGVADGMVKYAQGLALQINESVKSTTTGLRSLSDTLGLSTKPLDDFKHSINLISESGKALTDQQIADEIAKISDEMVRSLLPSVDQLGKYGETSAQTITRLGNEFKALETGAQNLGASAGYANELIKSMSFEARSAFVDQAGGIDALLQKTGYFFDNFLTPAEQMALKSDQLSAALKKLGVSADLTWDQFKKLITSPSTANDLRLGLLELEKAFYEVKNAQGQVTQSALETAKVLNIRSADDTEYGQRLNKSIQDTSASIKELEGVAAQLAGTINSIRPMSVEDARKLVSSGNRNDPNFQSALSVLSGMTSKGFSNVLDFRRAQGQNLAAIGSVQDSTQSQIDAQRKQLAQFEFEKQALQEGLAKAGSAFFNSVAKFDTGTSYVPKTGMAIIHKGERVVSNSQNKDLTALLGQLVNVMSGNSKSTDDMYKLLRRLTDGGNSLRTTVAA